MQVTTAMRMKDGEGRGRGGYWTLWFRVVGLYCSRYKEGREERKFQRNFPLSSSLPRLLLSCCSIGISMTSAFWLQVKIWFQNKRSKFKKLLKQGGNPHETDPLPGSATLSPRSPGLPPVWDVSASAKGVNMPPNSYMPGYSHWYSSPHQDTMQRPQMMWSVQEQPLGLANGASSWVLGWIGSAWQGRWTGAVLPSPRL